MKTTTRLVMFGVIAALSSLSGCFVGTHDDGYHYYNGYRYENGDRIDRDGHRDVHWCDGHHDDEHCR
jgi:hypothetical protein